MAGFGLRPLRHINGAPWNGATHRAYIAAADGVATFVGDAVRIVAPTGSTGSSENEPSGLCSVVQTAAGSIPVYGVVASFEPNRDNLSLQYRPVSVLRYVNLIVDPTVVFVIEEDGAGTPLALASIGLNADIVVGTGNTTTGRSAMQLNSDSQATTIGLPLKVLGLYQAANNNARVGNSAAPLCQWEVLINNWALAAGGLGTIGVA